jgi:hypothetical protein
MGSLLELTSNGKVPLTLDGETRTFLEDGDEVDMRGKFRSGLALPQESFFLPYEISIKKCDMITSNDLLRKLDLPE